jgi:hypothetical protein
VFRASFEEGHIFLVQVNLLEQMPSFEFVQWISENN